MLYKESDRDWMQGAGRFRPKHMSTGPGRDKAATSATETPSGSAKGGSGADAAQGGAS